MMSQQNNTNEVRANDYQSVENMRTEDIMQIPNIFTNEMVQMKKNPLHELFKNRHTVCEIK